MFFHCNFVIHIGPLMPGRCVTELKQQVFVNVSHILVIGASFRECWNSTLGRHCQCI